MTCPAAPRLWLLLHVICTYFIKSRLEAEANEFALHLLSYAHDFEVDIWARVLNDKRPDPKVVHRILYELGL